jgi:hypothetical protein
MKRILTLLLTLFLAFAGVLTLQIAMPFREEGTLHSLRVIVTLTSFFLGGAWLLFSLLAIPRTVLAVFRLSRSRAKPRAFIAPVSALLISALPVLLLAAAVALPGSGLLRMPGHSYEGPAPVLTSDQILLRNQLRTHVERLAGTLGDRNAATQYANLAAAADYIEGVFSNQGYVVQRQAYIPRQSAARGRTCDNIVVEIQGTVRPDEIVIFGAHYDSVMGCPGANDNASGVAALLELARLQSGQPSARTLRFVAFVNEEPPFFWTGDMGSAVYAARCRARNENIVAMLSLETLGYYSDAPHSQKYPSPVFEWFFPATGNFVGFIGSSSARALVRKTVASFRHHAAFPSQGAALPGVISGVEWSDNWGFSGQGYPALMVTDTAPFRYSYYHTPHDTPDKLDYDRFAYVVSMLEKVMIDLVAP